MQINVGIFVPLFTFPIIFLIVLMFRRRQLRKSPTLKVGEMVEEKVENAAKDRAREKFDYSYVKDGCHVRHGRIMSIKQFVYPQFLHRLTPAKISEIRLPWWFIFVAWGLWACLFLSSIFFCLYFGISFDDYKTKRWVAAMLLSLLSSLFITQPLKV